MLCCGEKCPRSVVLLQVTAPWAGDMTLMPRDTRDNAKHKLALIR